LRNRALVCCGEGEPDLHQTRVVEGWAGRAVSDELVVAAKGHGELEPLPGCTGVGVVKLGDEPLAGLRGKRRLPALVTGDHRVGAIGDERRQILPDEPPNLQAWCGQVSESAQRSGR